MQRTIPFLIPLCLLVVNSAGTNAQEINPTGKIEKVQGDFAFTEGPAWHPGGVLYFSDIPNSTIHTYDGRTVGEFTTNSRHTNGIMIASDGRMYTIDNGPNAGWGGQPNNEGPAGNCDNTPLNFSASSSATRITWLSECSIT